MTSDDLAKWWPDVSSFNLAGLPALVQSCAAQNGVDPSICAALIFEESEIKPWRRRYESGFYRRNLSNKKRGDLAGFVPFQIPTLNTEKIDRATSWGLMQILGDTARVHGFAEEDFGTLLIPEINVKLGCKYLAKLLRRDAEHTLEWLAINSSFQPFREFIPDLLKRGHAPHVMRVLCAYLRYNGGGRLEYPYEVYANIQNGLVASFFAPKP